MRRVESILGVLILIVITAVAFELFAADSDPNAQATPFMRTVDPASVKAGDEITATGDALDKARVAA